MRSPQAASGTVGNNGVGGGINGAGFTLLADIVAIQSSGLDCANVGGITDAGYNLDSDGSCSSAPRETSRGPILG